MNKKRILKVSYIGATNTNGTRVKIEDLQNDVNIIIPFDYTVDNMAISYLESIGIKIDSIAYTDNADYLFSDNFEKNLK